MTVPQKAGLWESGNRANERVKAAEQHDRHKQELEEAIKKCPSISKYRKKTPPFSQFVQKYEGTMKSNPGMNEIDGQTAGFFQCSMRTNLLSKIEYFKVKTNDLLAKGQVSKRVLDGPTAVMDIAALLSAMVKRFSGVTPLIAEKRIVVSRDAQNTTISFRFKLAERPWGQKVDYEAPLHVVLPKPTNCNPNSFADKSDHAYYNPKF